MFTPIVCLGQDTELVSDFSNMPKGFPKSSISFSESAKSVGVPARATVQECGDFLAANQVTFFVLPTDKLDSPALYPERAVELFWDWVGKRTIPSPYLTPYRCQNETEPRGGSRTSLFLAIPNGT